MTLRSWIKRREHPIARLLYALAMGVRHLELPVIPLLHTALYRAHLAVSGALSALLRIVYWTPLFKSRLSAAAPRLFLYGGMPLVLGPLAIRLGPDCRVSGQTTLSGRASGSESPELVVGANCDIGWQSTIAVGRRVVLGDNVRIAGRAFLAGYPGHPLNAAERARGLPEHDDQVGDIILEDDVWLATGVTVSAGVTIGRGTVVAAGSVVTKDLPPLVLAAGVPAKVIRSIEES